MAPGVSKPIHVLSFDGGGSRGLMEAIMIKEIMNLATLMRDDPKEVTKLLKEDEGLKKPETLKSFKDKVDEVKDPIHPNDVFQYIIGKS